MLVSRDVGATPIRARKPVGIWSTPAPWGRIEKVVHRLTGCSRSGSLDGPKTALLCPNKLAVMHSRVFLSTFPTPWRHPGIFSWSMDHRGWKYHATKRSLQAASQDGKVLWTWRSSQGARPSVPTADLKGKLYVLSSRGCLVVLLASNGGETQRICPDSTTAGRSAPLPPTLGPDGTIYLANNAAFKNTSGMTSAALEARSPDGWLRWRSPVEGTLVSQPLLSGSETICSVVENKARGSRPQDTVDKVTLLCLDGRGKQKWSRRFADRPAFMPLFRIGRDIYMSTARALFRWRDDGTLVNVVSLTDSRQTVLSQGLPFVSPGPAGLITVARGHQVLVLNKNLQVLWKASLRRSTVVSAPVLSGSGSVAVPTNHGLVLVNPPL